MYPPVPEDLLVNLSDSYDIVINLLENLPNYFAKTQVIDNCIISAMQGAS